MSGIESLLIGRILGGRYRIEEVIGRGGMGAVYRAVDERLGRPVALKVITVAGTGDAESRERLRARFFREARAAAGLPHHPNVVPVYDFGSDEALGLDYLVMELLRGSDLASRLARIGPPDLSAALRILIEAARGVAVGHQQGIIHRDIKPGNIFLARTPSGDVQVRVVDFGIAKVADDEDTLSQLTQDGRVPHSPAYASPEQLRGLSGLTPAADVFSLGAVGYQLLTGERPFSESDRNRISLGMPVEPPPMRNFNPAVPGAVETVIRKALAFDPEGRFASAAEMAEELEAAVRGIADRPIEPYIGGAPIIAGSELKHDEEVRHGTEVDFADEDVTRIAPVADDDRTLLIPPEPPTERPSARKRARPAASTPARRPPSAPTARRKPPAPPRRSRRGLGGMIVWAIVVATLAAAIVWGINAFESPGRLTLEDIEAETGVTDEEPAPPPNPAADALQFATQARSAYEATDFNEAARLFAQAVELQPDVWSYRRDLGLSLYNAGRFQEALDQLERARRIDPDDSGTYSMLARTNLELGDTAAAIAALERYVALEPDPESRRRATLIIRNLEVALQPELDLLGEPVDEPDTDLPSPADTLTAPSAPPDIG